MVIYLTQLTFELTSKLLRGQDTLASKQEIIQGNGRQKEAILRKFDLVT